MKEGRENISLSQGMNIWSRCIQEKNINKKKFEEKEISEENIKENQEMKQQKSEDVVAWKHPRCLFSFVAVSNQI